MLRLERLDFRIRKVGGKNGHFTILKGGINQENITVLSMCFIQFSSVHSLSRVWLFATPWIAAHQASPSITNSRSLLKPMSIESVMPSSHFILCFPLLLLPPIPPSIRVFSKESTLCIMWPKYWSFSFSISPSSEHPGLIASRVDWMQHKLGSRLLGETSITSDMQMPPPLWQKVKKN